MKRSTINEEDIMGEHSKKTVAYTLKKLKSEINTKAYLNNESLEIGYDKEIINYNKIEKTTLELDFSPKINGYLFLWRKA
jgi:hypothetical protein